MDTATFIDRYCTETDDVRIGEHGTYRVYLVSPAAIMSVMPSCDSNEDPDEVGLETSWNSTFEEKREDNEYARQHGGGPLVFLAREGFRTPLCVLTEEGEVDRFHNGHHRLAAAIDLGFTKVPVIFLESWGFDNYSDRWAVTEVRRSECPTIIPPVKAAV